MIKVVVFGDLPIATKIVMFLEKMDNVEVSVVIGNANPHNNDPWKDIPLLAEYCKINSVCTYTMDELNSKFKDNELTLGLSCRFSKIIKPETIAKFKNGIINMHGGLLPEFAGLYSANHTILMNSPIGGGTLHYVDEGIDTGDIIKRCEFPIMKDDTGYSVFQKTQIVLEENLEQIIPYAINGRVECVNKDDLPKFGVKPAYYNKNSLEGLKEIRIEDLLSDKALLCIRAFDFPGYEPAYFKDKHGNKIYLRYNI